MGFCYGVKRAIKIATAAAEKNGSVVTLGPLIHNPQVVNRLEKEGDVYKRQLLEDTETGLYIKEIA